VLFGGTKEIVNLYMAVKKIALILPSLQGGGMERVMTELARVFAANPNNQVHLILMNSTRRFYEVDEAVKIHQPPKKMGNRLLYLLYVIRFIRATVKQLKPDTILSFGETFNSYVLIATLFLGYPVYISDRSRPDKNWGHFQHLLRYIFYRNAKGIIAQTELSKTLMLQRVPGANIKVIGNPIKPMPIAPANTRKPIILTVGRLIGSKRIDLLIQHFNEAKQPGWTLNILGDGPERPKLEQLVQDLHLQDLVKFCGAHHDIAPFFNEASIFAFTSNSEGFPNALAEAMCAGLAPVSYNFRAGASDLITNEVNGFLVPMDDHALFLQQLKNLMGDSAMIAKFGAAAAESMKRYDLRTVADEYYNFITA
jgi:glycosyltransferase involved in cell wall biosynthesis